MVIHARSQPRGRDAHKSVKASQFGCIGTIEMMLTSISGLSSPLHLTFRCRARRPSPSRRVQTRCAYCRATWPGAVVMYEPLVPGPALAIEA